VRYGTLHNTFYQLYGVGKSCWAGPPYLSIRRCFCCVVVALRITCFDQVSVCFDGVFQLLKRRRACVCVCVMLQVHDVHLLNPDSSSHMPRKSTTLSLSLSLQWHYFYYCDCTCSCLSISVTLSLSVISRCLWCIKLWDLGGATAATRATRGVIMQWRMTVYSNSGDTVSIQLLNFIL